MSEKKVSWLIHLRKRKYYYLLISTTGIDVIMN